MNLEELLKNSLLAAAKADIDDGEVEVKHEAMSTYAAGDITVEIHSDIKTAALEQVTIRIADYDQLVFDGDAVHSFITVMARVLKGMTSNKP